MSFVARPNRRTLHELAHARQQRFGERIERGTVSIHVRHGDKFRDSGPQVPDRIYHQIAKALVTSSAGVLQPKYFLSSADPETIEYFRKAAEKDVQYVQQHRDNYAGGSPMSVPDTSTEMLYALLNLDLALECDAGVCTLSFMWCTLIDRLRATVRCKAFGHYRDAHNTLEGKLS